MPDLLLELFSEEIPARMQLGALSDVWRMLRDSLKKEGYAPAESPEHMYATPRRIAVWLKNLPTTQTSSETELKGPKIGAPEAALQGFLKKTGLKQSDLTERDGVYFAVTRKEGRQTSEVLKTIIEDTLKIFPWSKSMRWGDNDISWVRPLHSILCIFDGKVIPVEFGPVSAGNITYGHRFLAPDPITVMNPAEYEKALEKAHVIADREKRAKEIDKRAKTLAASNGLQLKEDPYLLNEVTGLVEWPVVLMGSIDPQFMDLPPEVLTTVMRTHQKYFALTDKQGKLSPYFLITANMQPTDGGKAIISGNERVLRARFSDARFFWDQDRKKPLDAWAEGLADVTFHAKLGSIADKVKRITAIAETLAPLVKADKKLVKRAAELCKADLVTGMVGEFAELQGIMGRYYALEQKEPSEVADAIRDHYLPVGPASPVPTQPVSICIALADKLDTLVSMFAIGEKPTGSKDPFALRRAALGVIRIILENSLRLNLKPFFAAPPAKAIALHMAHKKLEQEVEPQLKEKHRVGKYLTVHESAYQDLEDAVPANLADMLYDFFCDRLKVQLKESGLRHDVIAAVLGGGNDDLVRVVARTKALQDFLATEDGVNLLAAYKRAGNILAIEEKRDKTTYAAQDLKESVLKEKEEKTVADLLSAQTSRIENLRQNEQFVEAMKLLAELRTPVDRFFDKIMVNAEDRELRANRLRLLARIRASMDSIANFALIEG